METKPYLEEDEIRRAKMCIRNIQDKLEAVTNEIVGSEHPYKTYLLEKLNSMLWDTKCLINMCTDNEEE